MPSLVGKLTDIQSRLDALARQHRVAGASLGVLSGDRFLEFATGVANRNTGVEVTTDTLFQIGSNTKVYTATLVMQLVDAGRVNLDAPVRTYVPDLRLASTHDDALDAITVRDLLTHTSGIEGDYFEDFGRGDDCLERYVASFHNLGLIHPPHAMASYSNSAFCLAGHILERVEGKPYHQILREKLLAPLGLRATTVLLEEMIAHRYAVGHVPGPDGLQVAPRAIMARAQAAAGSLTSSTPREVLRFVRMHLDAGLAPDGSRVLSADAVAEMQRAQADLPRAMGVGQHVGLAWFISEWSGQRVIGHGGGTIGQVSFLQVIPSSRVAICLLTNSGTGHALWRDLGAWLFEELAGVEMPRVAQPADEPPALDLASYTGRYQRLGVSFEVTVEEGQLVMSVTQSGPLAAPGQPPQKLRLRPVDTECFHVRLPTGEGLVQFMAPDADGRPAYLHMGARVARRTPLDQDGGDSARTYPSSRAKSTATKPAAKASSSSSRTRSRSAKAAPGSRRRSSR